MQNKHKEYNKVTANTRLVLSDFRGSRQSEEVNKISELIKNKKINNISEAILKLADLQENNNTLIKYKNGVVVNNTKAAVVIKELFRLNGIKLTYTEIVKMSPIEIEVFNSRIITNNRLDKFDRKYKYKLISPIKEQIIKIEDASELSAFIENLSQKLANLSRDRAIKMTARDLSEVEGLLKNYILQRISNISKKNFKHCLIFEVDTNFNFSSEKVSKVKLIEAMDASRFNIMIKLDNETNILINCVENKIVISSTGITLDTSKKYECNNNKKLKELIDKTETFAYKVLKLLE